MLSYFSNLDIADNKFDNHLFLRLTNVLLLHTKQYMKLDANNSVTKCTNSFRSPGYVGPSSCFNRNT
jgi:hypothetical protein